MDGIFEKDYILTPEYCGMRSELSPLAPFLMFQAIAAQHAELLGVGGDAMARRGQFWLAVHTRVDFFSAARMMDTLTARTWAEPCGERDIRIYRSYTLDRGETRIAAGRTEWAVLGSEKRLVPFGAIGFPSNYPYPRDSAIAERPRRLRDCFADDALCARSTVHSTDIDLGRHMNNVAYVRRLLDCFTADELASNAIRSFEIHFSAPCLEGEPLFFYRQKTENGWLLGVRKENGKAAALASVILAENT